ncbi:transglycosylase SLT domain-containing protein [Actinopolymorpha singaporensis]|uniref:Transglycosylase SLT domain-containing protein n=1 Tax=Actinopolymorpha singaporensis TaxID=117157 RepID=A0A1H1YXB2_9ACTN|nr:transglycosylase SLT domain-containing protein [Actinopolymorpha singaporensis]SDT25977.1 Transglycosylase SLT domain-containing protein [Actinopolymorpha singaporensis]
MASYAGKHRAPAKHRARGRGAGFTTRLPAPSTGARRADATRKPARSFPAAAREVIDVRETDVRELVDVRAADVRADVREPAEVRQPEAVALPVPAEGAGPARRGFRISPAFAAVTAASLGVTGAVGAGVLVAGSHRTGALNNLAVSDLGGRGTLTAKRAAELKPKSATPRHTTRTVTPKPKATPTVAKKPEKVVPATGEDVIDRTAVERLRAAERASRAAEREALARERAAAQARARLENGSPKEIAARLVAARGWSDAQYQCLVTMWTRESSWNHHAVNASSGAYGIPQALPGSKMAAYGSDWRDNPTTQIKWGLAYIESRYGTPCGAWSWWQAHNWY